MIAMELKRITCASAIAIEVAVAPLTGRSRPRRRPAGAALRARRGCQGPGDGGPSGWAGPPRQQARWIHLTPTIRVFVSGTVREVGTRHGEG
jgi:hypothetical protein